MATPRLYYGWIVVAVAFVTMAIATNLRNSFALFFIPLIEEFQWGRGVTAFAFSLNMLMYTMCSPLIGFLMDRYGPRAVLPIAASALTLGMVGSSVITTLW